MAGRQPDHQVIVGQRDALQAVVADRFQEGVFEGHRDVELSDAQRAVGGLRADLDERDGDVGVLMSNRAMAAGTIVAQALANAPMRTRPASSLAIALSSASAVATSPKIVSAWRSRISPASVRRSGRVPRSISVSPSSASSVAICWETAESVSTTSYRPPL